MSEQPMGARRALQVARRYKALIGSIAIVGAVGGLGYAAMSHTTYTAQALVVLEVSPAAETNNAYLASITATQSVLLTSDPVLSGALSSLRSSVPVSELRSDITATSPAPVVLAVTAMGTTAQQAQDYANAVAQSYVTYAQKEPDVVGVRGVRLLQSATTADSGTSTTDRFATTGIIGALVGAAIGFIIALARSRGDKGLRERGEIANSVGLPVLAAIPVEHVRDSSGWSQLLRGYDPGAVVAWKLRILVEQLGLIDEKARMRADKASIVVVTMLSDQKAVALGPQLAVFTASLRIPTTLVVGSQQDSTSVAALRTAAAANRDGEASHLRYLRVVAPAVVNERHTRADYGLNVGDLTISVLVVDAAVPVVPASVRSAVTILGVSAGSVTAEQLARAATAVADAGGYVSGILVADPDPADPTTGLEPRLGGPVQLRIPSRLRGVPMETRK
jgi:capsular polysaccharide biosynthesis protein